MDAVAYHYQHCLRSGFRASDTYFPNGSSPGSVNSKGNTHLAKSQAQNNGTPHLSFLRS